MEEDRHDDVQQWLREQPRRTRRIQQTEVLQSGRLRLGAEVGVHQHQAVDPLGVFDGQLRAPHAANRQADQVALGYVQRVQQCQMLTGQCAHVGGGGGRSIGVTVAPEFGDDDPEVL